MEQKEITRYLRQTVLDENFRKLVETDIEKSFVNFNLTDKEKDTLRNRSSEMSELVAIAINDILNTNYPELNRGDNLSENSFVTNNQSVQIRPIIVIPPPPVTINPVVRPSPTPSPTTTTRTSFSDESLFTKSAEEAQNEIKKVIDSIKDGDNNQQFENLLKLVSLVESFPTLDK